MTYHLIVVPHAGAALSFEYDSLLDLMDGMRRELSSLSPDGPDAAQVFVFRGERARFSESGIALQLTLGEGEDDEAAVSASVVLSSQLNTRLIF